jgi:hypothetical protein
MVQKRLTTTTRTLQYFNVTAFPGGDHGLFGVKLSEIIKQVTPEDREYDYVGTSVNIELINSEKEDKYIRGTVQQMRSSAPSKRRRGHTESTPIALNDDEGIDEKTHFIYCPDTSLLCIEYNYHGPKVGLLTSVVNGLYKEHIEKTEKRNSYEYIQTRQAVKKVTEQREIRSVVAKLIDPKTTGHLSDDLDLPDVFKEFKAPKHTSVEITLKSDVRGGVALTMDAFKKMFLRNKGDLEHYDKLKVKVNDDETGKPIEYDLVHDKLEDSIIVNFTPGTSEVDTKNIIKIMEEHIAKAKEQYILK